MTNTFRVCVAVLVLSVLNLIATGCDQTADEYHQQKVEQQVALIDSVKGQYNGTVTTNGSTCNIGLQLEPQVTSTNSSDGTTTVSQASMKGKVSLDCGTWSASEPIPSMSYTSFNNSQTGTFTGNFTVPLSATSGSQASNSAQMSITGTITGTQMSGTIDMDNQDGFTGQFTAQLGAAPSSAGSSTSGTTNNEVPLEYVGSYTDSCPPGTVDSQTGGSACTVSVSMSTLLLPQEGADFFNNFSSQQAISVTMRRTGQVKRIKDGQIFQVPLDPLGFVNEVLDLKNHRIDGTSTGVNNNLASLNCKQIQINATTKGWSCTLLVLENGNPYFFTAVPVKKGN